jgi:hypothetical protein
MSCSKVILLFAFSLTITAFSTASHGADWKIFYQIEEGPKYYFDKESLVTPQKGLVQVSMKVTLAEDKSEEAEQYRGRVEIICKSKSYRVLEEESESPRNEERNQQPSSGQDMRRLSLDSAMGSLWDNLCQ